MTPFAQRENVDVVLDAGDPKQYPLHMSFLPRAG
jgi:hypothetical protein